MAGYDMLSFVLWDGTVENNMGSSLETSFSVVTYKAIHTDTGVT